MTFIEMIEMMQKYEWIIYIIQGAGSPLYPLDWITKDSFQMFNGNLMIIEQNGILFDIMSDYYNGRKQVVRRYKCIIDILEFIDDLMHTKNLNNLTKYGYNKHCDAGCNIFSTHFYNWVYTQYLFYK